MKLELSLSILLLLNFTTLQSQSPMLKKFTIHNFTTPTHSYPLQVSDIVSTDPSNNTNNLIMYEIVINGKRSPGFLWLNSLSVITINKIYVDASGRSLIPIRLLPLGNTTYSIALLYTDNFHPVVMKLDNATGNVLSCIEFSNVPDIGVPTDIVVTPNNHYRILCEGIICFDYDILSNTYTYTLYKDSNQAYPNTFGSPHFVKSYHNSESVLTGDVTFFGFTAPSIFIGGITEGFVYKENGNTSGTYYTLALNGTSTDAIQINGADAGPTYNIAIMNSSFEFVLEANHNLVSPYWTKYYNPPTNTTMGLVYENNHGTKAGYGSSLPLNYDYFSTWIKQPFTGYGFLRYDVTTGNIPSVESFDLNVQPFYGAVQTTIRSYTYDPSKDFTAVAWHPKVVDNVDQPFYYIVENSLTPSDCAYSAQFIPTIGNLIKTPRTFIKTHSAEYVPLAVPIVSATPKTITVEDICFDIGSRKSSKINTVSTEIKDATIVVAANDRLTIHSEKNIRKLMIYNSLGQLLYKEDVRNQKYFNLIKGDYSHGEKTIIIKLFFDDHSFITKKVILANM